MNELRTLASLVKKVADLHEASWDEHLGEYRYTVSVGDAITQVCAGCRQSPKRVLERLVTLPSKG